MSNVRRGVAAVALALCVVPSAVAHGPQSWKRFARPSKSGAIRATVTWEDLSAQTQRLELQYRHRLARLHRLRDLAVHGRDHHRVAKIDRMIDRLQDVHVQHCRTVRAKLDPQTCARLDDALANGRDPQEWARFRRKLSEERREQLGDMREDRREFRDNMHDANREHRQDMRAERDEHRDRMREEHLERRHDLREERAEARTRPWENPADKRFHVGDDRRPLPPDARHGSVEREAARAAHEQEWSDSRDLTTADMPGTRREDAIKRRAAERFKNDVRQERDDTWRRAALRDGSLPDTGARFRMPSQEEADELAGSEISDENADAEFEALGREIDGDQ